jgi:AcrR family transcriptional regulator
MGDAERNREHPRGEPAARPEGLRERKKKATRQLISNIATSLFTERGFEQVTVDEVAAAAEVSKMTVFNYFPRKEDLFFDRSDEAHQLLRDALARRGRRSPLAALRSLVHELVEQRHPLVRIDPRVAGFWKVVADSPALRARTREISVELERDLARLLAASVDAPSGDPTARLLAALLLAAWRVAFREALQRQRAARSTSGGEVLLALLDRGFTAASAAARDTPYR